MSLIIPQLEHPCVIVGRYSEGFYQCSYNHWDVFEALFFGGLNDRAGFITQSYPEGTRRQLGNCFREDGYYEQQLFGVLLQAGGWPVEWLPDPVMPFLEALAMYKLQQGRNRGWDMSKWQHLDLRVGMLDRCWRRKDSLDDLLYELRLPH